MNKSVFDSGAAFEKYVSVTNSKKRTRDLAKKFVSGICEAESSKLGSNLGQLLFFTGLILVYGFGSFWLCWELITDGKFAESGDPKDKIPVYIRFGIPILITGIGVLFFTVLLQRLKAAKTDKYTDVQI